MFLKKSLVAALALSFCFIAGAGAEPIPESAKIGGFAIGCQAWSFRVFSAMEAVEKTSEAGGKVIEFFPGQHFSREDKTPVNQNLPDEKIEQLKEQLRKYNVRAVNFGVGDIPKDETQARKIFEFAKKMGFYALTTESTGAIDTIEKLAKEFDICVGFHNHPRKPGNANYKVWDPGYILELVKNRDAHIGAAVDVGHWTTDGTDVIASLKLLEGRIVSMHVKDRPVAGKPSTDVPLGTGVIDFVGIFDELKRQNFAGNISVEYETNWEKSSPQIGQCIGFLRGYAATRAK